jgi:peptidoglycan/xylan/chitin deacetylase (PgdA/CDA1 family)
MKALKSLFWKLITFSGLSWFVREVLMRNKAGILLYHEPTPENLEQHLKFLSKYYNFITLDLLVEAISTKDWIKIPPKALVITIDDGHQSNYALLEVFKKYHIKPTIFLCSQIVNTQRHFWWKNNYPNHYELKILSRKEMLKKLKEKVDYFPEKPYKDRQALNLDELEKMKPFIDFQAHTCFHPILPLCEDNESKAEIQNCKTELEELLKQSVKHFAYPNGDYLQREIEYLKMGGYLSARTVKFGWNTVETDPYQLLILSGNDDVSVDKLSAQMTGIFNVIEKMVGSK